MQVPGIKQGSAVQKASALTPVSSLQPDTDKFPRSENTVKQVNKQPSTWGDCVSGGTAKTPGIAPGGYTWCTEAMQSSLHLSEGRALKVCKGAGTGEGWEARASRHAPLPCQFSLQSSQHWAKSRA